MISSREESVISAEAVKKRGISAMSLDPFPEQVDQIRPAQQ